MELHPPLVLAEPSQDRDHEIFGVCRGIGLRFRGLNLVGEGMGIGGVIGLVGRKAVFPLKEETYMLPHNQLRKKFHLNGLSIKYWRGVEVERPYKIMRETLSPLYIKSRWFRPFYKLLMAGRSLAMLRSRYTVIGTLGTVEARYRLGDKTVDVEISVNPFKKISILVANELSGRLFTTMEIDGRIINNIPPWLEVDEPVRFHSPSLRLSMHLSPVDGCKMFIGREVLGKRLDWAGASYQLSDGVEKISYRVSFDWST
ncbi:hypothetical protein CSUB_C1110 [Candidatus Caldarchaeum subterraneum]|uniref:Uncharacterized protein n=2 Tax=Caldiarchaeum subterraneum TaxID=311458 RepID=E6N7A8_CALS0|nr:hypothetical protein HGMM_F33A05C16 [Candidatus Caldarchaeum subterraneum]BAJ50962.1 hypothetical protein CSUB_C1110 [Candidatus Caldarchaeum subterraneum]